MIRLRALRLKEVGCFTGGVALEGLGDGLNVLAGPNELGKSTLLRALRIAFEEKHTGTAQRIKDLAPYQGGTPQIEVDFESVEGHWRLSKSYLGGKAAALLNLGTQDLQRNNDVQARLDEIVRGPSDLARFQFLWVEQGDTLRDVEANPMGAGLSALVAGEIDALSTDAAMRAVQARVRKELSELQTNLTDKARIKKGGRLQIAQQELAALVDAHADVARRAADQALRLERLAVLTAERDALAGGDGIAALNAAQTQAADRLSAATAAHREERDALKARDARQTELKLAQQALDTYTTADTALADAARAAANVEAVLAARAPAEVAAASAQASAAALVAQRQAELAALDQALSAARAAEAAVAGSTTRTRLTRQLADARSAAADRDHAIAEAASLAAVTPEAVRALKLATADLARRDAAFAAIAPEVTIELDAGGAGRLSVNGAALAADTVLHPETPLTIEIAGIGRIRIAPHPATASPTALAQRATARSHIDALLVSLGVTTVDTAEDTMARREAASQKATAATQRLALTAPMGLDGLIAEMAAVAHHPDDAQPPARSSAELGPAHTAGRALLEQAERDLNHTAIILADLATTRAAEQSALAIHRSRIDALRQTRGSEVEALAQRAAAMTARQSADAAFTSATLVHRVWLDKIAALSIADLETAARLAADALSQAQAQLQAATLEIKSLEGALQASSADDSAAELSRLTEACDMARRKLADIEDEHAALLLLHDAFEASAAAGRDQLSAPIRARIEPYLAHVLPGARVTLDAGFAPAALQRRTTTEPLERLSQGTREQIAIITRLGLGKLLAERNAAVPLILDDALVFADDTRIEAMFATLALAARDHQVIVFTCRTKAFASLQSQPGTTTLALAPWTPAL